MSMMDIDRLYRAYSNYNSFFKWSFPRQLQVVLGNYARIPSFEREQKIEAAIAVCREYLNVNSFVKERFNALRLFEHSATIRNLNILQDAQLLDDNHAHENIRAVLQHQHPLHLIEALSILNRENLLTQENYTVVHAHDKPTELSSSLVRLQRSGLLSSENRQAIIMHSDPSDLATALCTLQRDNLLNAENHQAILRHQKPANLANVLYRIQKSNLLTEENYNAFINHHNPTDLFHALLKLQKYCLLNDTNYSVVLGHPHPSDLAYSLVTLQNSGLLNEDNHNLVLEHPNPTNLRYMLSLLAQANLLHSEYAPEWLKAVIESQHSEALAEALRVFLNSDLITDDTQGQLNFNNLIQNSAVLLSGQVGQLWQRIPLELNEAQYQDIINICNDRNFSINEKRRRVTLYIYNEILEEQIDLPLINDSQSTHTGSVHKSVSESVSKLKNRFQDHIKGDRLDVVIEDLIQYIQGSADDPISEAAKRCINRLSAADYVFEDPNSAITTRQLLAFIFLGINDKDNITGSLEDAKDALIKTLYEIQRGYNLNEQGTDNQRDDSYICASGTFNKLVNGLQGVLPEFTVVYITKDTASLKLLCVTREEALHYLDKNIKIDTMQEFMDSTELLNKINDEGIEVIWNDIKPEVITRMFDEFGGIFNDDPDDRAFMDMIDAGQYATVDISSFQTKLQDSIHYEAYRNSANTSFSIFARPTEFSNEEFKQDEDDDKTFRI